jgi:hypothetical protein
MEQLILVAVIVVFSILEAAARRQKRRQGGAGAGSPPLPEEWAEEPESRREPQPASSYESYDHDPSFDDAVEEPFQRRIEGDASPGRQAGEERTPAPRSSEDLIPRDIWEEIAALARGERPTGSRPPPAPRKEPASPAPPPSRIHRVPQEPRGSARHPVPARASHPVHDTHPELGRPVSERLTSPARRTAGSRPGKDVQAVRRLLAGGGTSLRQAVILQDILGPPASQRRDPGDPSA